MTLEAQENFCFWDSPVGPLTLVSRADFLAAVRFGRLKLAGRPEAEGVLAEAIRQLELYFDRRLRHFNLPLAPAPTEFQGRVREQLLKIEYGQTMGYSRLAAALGQAQAARAVGQACARNPLAIVVPCHRVVGSRGQLTGYAGSTPVKKFLLILEAGGLL